MPHNEAHPGRLSAVQEGRGATSLDSLWLLCQQRLIAYVAHDLKGALNGLSVNLEVVRARAQQADTPAVAVGRFAEACGEQLAVVIRMCTALLSAGRGVAGPAEVSTVARQAAALLEDTVRSNGGKLEVIVEGGFAGPTVCSASAVRLAIVEPLMTAVEQKRDILMRVRATTAPIVEMRSEATFELRPDVARALADVGITFQTDGHGISIRFPGPA